MNPKVTVYITNHNYGRYIDQAIKSVLDQLYQDFELIIIDDGSTDDSLEVISKYESLDKVFVILQRNRGLNVTNNIALKQARGDYIMRLDADDFLDPHTLELMVSKLDKNPELALVFPDYYEVDEFGEIITQVRRHNFGKDVTLMDQPAHGACTMVRRKVLLEIGGYDESFNRQDGYDLWLNIITDYLVENINLPLFYYRQHGKSLTQNEESLLAMRSQIKAKHIERRGGDKLSVLGIIPVRGIQVDPRSLPLEKLGEQKLIDWTIQSALGSKLLTDVLVTTPDDSILQYLEKQYGERIILHKRQIELARINTKLEDTLLGVLQYYANDKLMPDASMVLNIEAPFRSTMYIDKAIHTMELYQVDVVCGVRGEDDMLYRHDGSGLKPVMLKNGLRLERDDIYRKSGGMTLVNNDFLQNKGKMIGGRIGHITMDQKAAFTIKSSFDWQIAELITQIESKS